MANVKAVNVNAECTFGEEIGTFWITNVFEIPDFCDVRINFVIPLKQDLCFEQRIVFEVFFRS